jgi:2-polyprenyl-3-methyl-5-hydroxy-6-metoxy-1,4-benzoquinol methylase
MTILIAGPLWPERLALPKSANLGALGLSDRPLVYGHSLTRGEVPQNALVAYDLLNPAFEADFAPANADCDFPAEPILTKIIATEPEQAVVLVTPLSELREQIKQGAPTGEYSLETTYARTDRLAIFDHVNLFRIYETLFDFLEDRKIPVRVMLSSHGRLEESDRVFVHAHLKGKTSRLPTREAVQEIVNDPKCHYQAVLLPYGQTTPIRFDHLGGSRLLTFRKILPRNLVGRSILDVGCALGDLLFMSERLGARRLVGIEEHDGRFSAAISIRDILGSEADIHHCDFLDYELNEEFDHVFVLNVIHHVFDFYRFLKKAARAAKSSMIIEFPTLTDNRFRGIYGFSVDQMKPLNELPLIALSGRAAIQSYVYSPVAIQNLVLNEIGGFMRHSIVSSPISDRVIMIFDRQRE